MPQIQSTCSITLLWGLSWLASSAPTISHAADLPQIVAHRGLLRHAPENTPANFRACLELRLGFEFDVRRSKDGHLICLHDDTVDRTTDGKGKAGDLTLEELRRLDAGSWFHASYREERIPTVDEVFALLAANPRVDVLVAVDIKGDDPAIEADTAKLAKKHGVLARLIFIGRTIESPEVRARFKTVDKQIRVAHLAGRREELDAALADEQADWVYVRFVPTSDDVARVRAAGKRLFIAGPTVAGAEDANWRAAAAAGVDAILTDYPLELRKALTGRPNQPPK